MGRVIGLTDEEEAQREADLAEAEGRVAVESEDFDAFWRGVERKPTVLRNVFGVDVVLPPALPLRFEVEARRAQESSSEEDTRRMVGLLFGDDALDAWVAKGMDVDQFAVLLMWGTANTRSPGSLTLPEALEIYRTRSLGNAPAAATKTGSGRVSAATGQRSKRTSRASTSSRKKK